MERRSFLHESLGHARDRPLPALQVEEKRRALAEVVWHAGTDKWLATNGSQRMVHGKRMRRSRHEILEIVRDLALCRGPGSNRRHMVLQPYV